MLFDLFTIWAIERDEPEAPWLVDAWDEFSIETNETGWNEAVAKAKANSHEVRIVRIRVRHEAIVAAFESSIIEGEVLS